MKTRTRNYFKIQEVLKIASNLRGCIEFPHFGARYPDAACHEGYLWDLDSGDSEGLTSGGDDPCPCCNTKSYIKDLIDWGISVRRIVLHLKFIFSKYGSVKPNP